MKTTNDLAKALGVAPGVVRAIRDKLTRGLHWGPDPDDGRRTLWTPDGEAAARRELGLEEPEAPPFDTADPSGDPEPVEGVVVSRGSRPGLPHYPNERVIRIRLDDGRTLMVGCRSSRNFAPTLQGGAPMRVRAVWRGGRWEVEAGRCPRWPGKW